MNSNTLAETAKGALTAIGDKLGIFFAYLKTETAVLVDKFNALSGQDQIALIATISIVGIMIIKLILWSRNERKQARKRQLFVEAQENAREFEEPSGYSGEVNEILGQLKELRAQKTTIKNMIFIFKGSTKDLIAIYCASKDPETKKVIADKLSKKNLTLDDITKLSEAINHDSEEEVWPLIEKHIKTTSASVIELREALRKAGEVNIFGDSLLERLEASDEDVFNTWKDCNRNLRREDGPRFRDLTVTKICETAKELDDCITALSKITNTHPLYGLMVSKLEGHEISFDECISNLGCVDCSNTAVKSVLIRKIRTAEANLEKLKSTIFTFGIESLEYDALIKKFSSVDGETEEWFDLLEESREHPRIAEIASSKIHAKARSFMLIIRACSVISQDSSYYAPLLHDLSNSAYRFEDIVQAIKDFEFNNDVNEIVLEMLKGCTVTYGEWDSLPYDTRRPLFNSLKKKKMIETHKTLGQLAKIFNKLNKEDELYSEAAERFNDHCKTFQDWHDLREDESEDSDTWNLANDNMISSMSSIEQVKTICEHEYDYDEEEEERIRDRKVAKGLKELVKSSSISFNGWETIRREVSNMKESEAIVLQKMFETARTPLELYQVYKNSTDEDLRETICTTAIGTSGSFQEWLKVQRDSRGGSNLEKIAEEKLVQICQTSGEYETTHDIVKSNDILIERLGQRLKEDSIVLDDLITLFSALDSGNLRDTVFEIISGSACSDEKWAEIYSNESNPSRVRDIAARNILTQCDSINPWNKVFNLIKYSGELSSLAVNRLPEISATTSEWLECIKNNSFADSTNEIMLRNALKAVKSITDWNKMSKEIDTEEHELHDDLLEKLNDVEGNFEEWIDMSKNDTIAIKAGQIALKKSIEASRTFDEWVDTTTAYLKSQGETSVPVWVIRDLPSDCSFDELYEWYKEGSFDECTKVAIFEVLSQRRSNSTVWAEILRDHTLEGTRCSEIAIAQIQQNR